MCAQQCGKHFITIFSFNPQNNPKCPHFEVKSSSVKLNGLLKVHTINKATLLYYFVSQFRIKYIVFNDNF